MNDIQTVTVYFKIVYALVAVAIIGYSIYLANAARQARARVTSSLRSSAQALPPLK